MRWATYLNFRGETREAMEYYRGVFGGELLLSTAHDLGVALPADRAEQVMHAQLTSPSGMVLLASDIHAADTDEPDRGNLYAIMIVGDDAAATASWLRLAEGGQITTPLGVAPWGDRFGACVDRFGITWLVNVLSVNA